MGHTPTHRRMHTHGHQKYIRTGQNPHPDGRIIFPTVGHHPTSTTRTTRHRMGELLPRTTIQPMDQGSRPTLPTAPHQIKTRCRSMGNSNNHNNVARLPATLGRKKTGSARERYHPTTRQRTTHPPQTGTTTIQEAAAIRHRGQAIFLQTSCTLGTRNKQVDTGLDYDCRTPRGKKHLARTYTSQQEPAADNTIFPHDHAGDD